ncbi:sialate O-acetylesterase [Niabella aquatica]
MSKRLVFIAYILFLLLNIDAAAKVRLTSIWSSNMVLQQNSEVLVTGTARASARLYFSGSWNLTKKEIAYTDKEGNFELRIKTPGASKNSYTICFDDGEPLYLTNILIGDIWFCSGQSNMEMPVKGFRGQPVYGSLDAITEAKSNRLLRLFTVKNAWSIKPLSDGIDGRWTTADPGNVAAFSAVAYFFANKLNQIIDDVPIGVINCSWSMSKIEAWMSKEMLSAFPGIALPDLQQKEFGWAAGTPTLLYNAMVHPWKGFAIKGMLWYQGEANTPDPQLYKKLFPEMLKGYRNLFRHEKMPFYYVQLVPWKSVGNDSLDWAYFRQVQLELSQELEHVGMVHTGDLGDEVFIHPPRKREVGERLAFWALSDTYGLKGFYPTGPVIQSAVMKDHFVEMTFKYGDHGLNPENEAITGFEIAGADGIFLPANAVILNATPMVKVWNDSIIQPYKVRYCFSNYKTGNLTNNYGFPAAPFLYTLTSRVKDK